MKNTSVMGYFKSFRRANKINKEIAIDVINMFNKGVNELIQNGYEFKMPYKLGYLSVIKYKQKIRLNDDGSINKNKLKTNWAATRQLRCKKYPGMDYRDICTKLKSEGKAGSLRVFHFNEHTDGFICRYRWDKGFGTLKNKSVYKFLPTKDNRLGLCKKILAEGASRYRISLSFGNHDSK